MPLILWTSDLSKSIKISLHFTFKKISFDDLIKRIPWNWREKNVSNLAIDQKFF